MNEFNFESIFTDLVPRLPSFRLTKIDAESLEMYRKTVLEVKNKNNSSLLELEYDVINQVLTIRGTAIDLFWFGYFTGQTKK